VLTLYLIVGVLTGKPIPYKIVPRRPGDIASCYCDPSRARELLGWEAKRGVEAMCADSWNWQSNNRNGYKPTVASGTAATAN